MNESELYRDLGLSVVPPRPADAGKSFSDAELECEHGRLPGDKTPPCGCWESEDSQEDTAAHVTIMMVMPEIMSLASVKARFSEIVDRVARQQERVIVTRNGEPAAVLVSPDDLESLEETLAIMSDRSLMAQIRESERALERGEPGASVDDLRADLERRRRRRA